MTRSNEQHLRQADQYLCADIMSWYTDSPVEYWEEMLSELPQETFNLYVDWASQLEDSLN